MIGHEIDGRYRLDAELGAGGVGTVYRAVHLESGVAVAVKVLRPDLASTAEFRLRFEREAKALHALVHPNVVTVRDSGVANDVVYLVMDLLEGETLSERLKRGPLDAFEAESTLTQLLSALAFAHEQSLVHRDVKPANVFLERGPGGAFCVKLLDFGLAKFLNPENTDVSLTRAGQVFGTPSYMAPEQIAGQPADCRVDVYAAGILYFEMLAGKPPFRGDTSETMRQHVMEEVPFAELPAHVATDKTVALIRRATAKTRAERFANAGEMLAELGVEARDAATDMVGVSEFNGGDRDGGESEPSSSFGRTLARMGITVVLGVSLAATAVAGAAVYLALTPGHDEVRQRLERILGVSLAPRTTSIAKSASSEEPRPSASAATSDVVAAKPKGDGVVVQTPATAPPERAHSIPSDPWVSSPPELARLVAKASRPRGLDRKEILLVHQYNAKHPTDPRGHLLLGRGYVGRKWFKDAVSEYAIAIKVSDSARGDPRMLKDLLTLVEFGSTESAKLLTESFGEAAIPAIDHALGGGHKLPNPESAVLLERLRKDIAPVAEPRPPI